MLEYDIVNYYEAFSQFMFRVPPELLLVRKVGVPSILWLSVDDTRVIRMLVGYFS